MYSTLGDRSASKGFNENNEAKRRRFDGADREYREVSRSYRTYDKENIDIDASAIRILTRRYQLTKTGYKYLDIGVAIKPPSYVNIVLGDRNGKEISLTPEAWKGLVEQKQTIVSYLRSNIDETNVPSPLSVGNLTLRFTRINNLPILRLELPTTRLAISLATLLTLYELQCCVDRIASSLNSVLKDIDEKYARFNEIAGAIGGTDPAAVAKAIRDSEFFDRNNIIDCEIVALCFR